MLKCSLTVLFLTMALLLVSCSTKPDYDEELPATVDNYFNNLQKKVEVSNILPVDSMYKDYENTVLNLTDNRDVKDKYPHTPFVTRYDPDTKVNVGPGHVPGKTKWETIIEAEASISETEPFRQWETDKSGLKDSPFQYLKFKTEDGKFMHTRWSYLAGREIGPNYVNKKTKFSTEVWREVDPELYDPGFTKWDAVYEKEVGPGFDPDFTTYNPSFQEDVGAFGHEQKGEIHYGPMLGVTKYSHVWGIDMFRKDPAVYEKVPSSKHDYTELDKAYAPDRQPRIAEPEIDPLGIRVPWVEDRKVLLDKDVLDKVEWKWRNTRAEKLTFELAQKVVMDVAKEVMEYVQNAKDLDRKWEEEGNEK